MVCRLPVNGASSALEHLGGGHSLFLLGRQGAGEDGLGDQGQGNAQVAGRDDRPLAGSLLAGRIEDQVDHRLAGVGIGETQDVSGDLDQVAVQRSAIPAGEDVVHRRRLEAEHGSHHMIGLADQLHVAVFDAVVDHLDEVPGALGPHPVAAGRAAVNLGGDRLEDRLDVRPGVGVSARHDRGALARPLPRLPRRPCR